MNVTRRARLLNHRALRDTTILNSPFSILNLFYKNKKAPVPDFSWDRSEYALAVPPRLTQTASTLLTHQTMRAPLITGGVPVALIGPGRPFAVPSKVHSLINFIQQSHHLLLSWMSSYKLLLFFNGLLCYGYTLLYQSCFVKKFFTFFQSRPISR